VTADTYARLDAAYLLGALEAEERLGFEAHLATCSRCQASLADISVIPPLLAGLDESVLGAPIEAVATPVPNTLLPRLLQAAARERAHRRWLTTGVGLLAAACAIALIVILGPAASGPNPASWAMTALVATPVNATVVLQPRSWGTEIDLTCWSQRGAAESPGEWYELVAHSADGTTYNLGSWRLVPGRRITFTGGTALSETQINDIQITRPHGPAILGLAVPRALRTADR
jgi:hypothetical protein